MLKEEGKIGDDLINRLMSWRHSGFSVHNEVRVRRDDGGGREALSILVRNTFSVEKLTYIEETATVIYRSKMAHGNNSKKNFEVYRAEEFIAAIAQHIPEKSFQMVRYYGWYSNKSRGIRNKQGAERSSHEPVADKDIEIIDVSDYQPPRIPSKSWRECMKKVYPVEFPRGNPIQQGE